MRTKQEITKSVYIRFRIEPKSREIYFRLCKKNDIKPSKELRLFVLNRIKIKK